MSNSFNQNPETSRSAPRTEAELTALYEKYDPERTMTPIQAEVRTLIQELYNLQQHGEGNTWGRLFFTDIAPAVTPKETLEALQRSGARELFLRENTEELSIPQYDALYGNHSITKQDAALIDSYVRAWQWETPKQFLLKPEDAKGKGEILTFPDNAQMTYGQLDLTLLYAHPNQAVGTFAETVSLRSDTDGELSLNTNIWASCYAETGYEGHDYKRIPLTDHSREAFLNTIAQVIGDSPRAF